MVATLMKVLCVIVACMVVSMPYMEAAIPCPAVSSFFAPCVKYLITSGGAVPPTCCDGLKKLSNAATTTPDRQQACNCLLNFYKSSSSINQDNAVGLSGKCGLSITYTSPTTDCANSLHGGVDAIYGGCYSMPYCPAVSSFFAPCVKYLITSGGAVPPTCCDGLKKLSNAATTTPDRQQACNCLLNFYKSSSSINQDNAVGLSGKCGLSITYTSPTTDCAKVI
ncbi:non-specific lipid-transfer protein [Artemisia annua]|uniref:Non-specific lipid-transfer protein n=1 Tax=Artemisia annua TaxID=35608 RepID=A0A2U1Q9P9_ARTAN|nr:non-specific lipid-transfer protein [Artemisia annua]